MRIIPILLTLALALPALAQNTCFTDPHGTTICSSPGTVIHGSTNSTGSSIYRDDRGNLLDFQTDQTGKASVELRSGESIDWSQGVLGEKKYPFNDSSRPQPAPIANPAAPGNGIVPVPSTIPRQP